MKEYHLPVKSKKLISENVISLTFDISGTDFKFRSGQYITVRLIDPVHEDYKQNIRSFSIVNPPHIKNEISVVIRLSGSGFSKNIIESVPGMLAAVSEPMGNLNLEINMNITDVFIAGGVGITPFKSMIEDLLHLGHSNEIILFYSNRNKSSAAFLDEFFELSEKHSHFKFIPVVDDVNDEMWNYEKGFISAEMLRKYISDLSKPVYHIVGPPQMVDSVLKILSDNGVDTKNIKTERY
ncbi:ferredoxin--NADP reductase [soil metagenome]